MRFALLSFCFLHSKDVYFGHPLDIWKRCKRGYGDNGKKITCWIL